MKILKRLSSISLSIALVCSSFSGVGYRLNVHAEETVGKTFYVSLKGNDSNLGTVDAPFATLEKARDAIRDLKNTSGLPQGGVTVYLREGAYNRSDSFQLTEQDSGTESSPIVYKAYGNEKVSLTGGYNLDAKAFTTVNNEAIRNRLPVESRDKIVQIDLKAQGITEYGQIPKAGYGWPKMTPAPELFINGKSMTLSRYPNTETLTTGSVIQTGFIPRDHMPDMPAGNPSSPDYVPQDQWISQPGPIFTYTDSHIDNWSQESDAWLFGYWYWDWADDTLKIKSIDTTQKQIAAVQPSMYGIRSNQRYYAFNLLCEIDMPGEWYLDRTSGILYLYPETDINSSEVQLSVLNKPLVDMNKVNYTTFKDITFEISTGHGIKMIDSSNNKVIHSTFRRLGQKAIMIGDEEELANDPTREKFNTGYSGGYNNGIISSDIYDVGQGGIYILGGNRMTLTPGGNYVENCNIYNYARILRTYTPGIFLNGVGNRASNNLIHNAPHFGIQFNGNDNIMENNEIYSVCEETSDSGVIYSGRDWTYRGNIIKNNYIHDIKNNGGLGSYAIYLDDLMCSIEATGNIFYNISKGVFLIGGGRDSIVKNNIMIDCGTAMLGDNRGMTWTGTSDHARIPDGTCYKNLMSVPYQSEVWATKYPTLTTILDNTTDKTLPTYYKKPAGNVVTDNVLYNTTAMNLSTDFKTTSTWTNNKTYASTVDAGFVDKGKRNFALKPDSIIYKDLPGFNTIPFDSIGLKIDEYRTSLQANIADFNLVSPANNATNVDPMNVVLKWQQAVGAGWSQLIIAEDYEFTKVVLSKDVTTTSFAVDLPENKTYYWKVVAGDISNSFSGVKQSTEIFKFTTGQLGNFIDGFEAGADAWTADNGSITLSNERAYSGSYSYKVDQDRDSITKNFTQKYYGIVTIWYYDEMVSNTRHMVNVTDSLWAGLGVDTAKTSTSGATKYQVRIDGTYTASTVTRTKGWHKFTWDYSTGNAVVMYIDDVNVATGKTKCVNKINFGDQWDSPASLAAGYYDDIKFENIRVAVTGVELSSTSMNLNVGQTSALTATVKPENAGNKLVTWSSDNTNVATVDESGNVTAVASGTANITATTVDGSYKAVCAVTAVASTNAALTSITINGTALNDFAAGTADYNVILPAGTTAVPKVAATAEDSSASLVVTDAAALPGTTTIVVTAQDGTTTKTYNINFTVDKLKTVTIAADNTTLDRTKTGKLSIAGKLNSGSDADLTKGTIQYTSSNPDIVSVDENGVITANNVGSADITAIVTLYDTVVQSNVVTINVNQLQMSPVEIEVNKPKSIIEVGEETTVTLSAKGANNLYGFDVCFKYDPTLFDVSVTPKAEFNLGSDGITQDGNGNVRVVGVLKGQSAGISGDIDLVTVKLKAKSKDAATDLTILKGAQFSDANTSIYTLDKDIVEKIAVANSDITGGGIDIGDLTAVAKAFGTKEGDAIYKTVLDMNKDNTIDIVDVAYVAKRLLAK